MTRSVPTESACIQVAMTPSAVRSKEHVGPVPAKEQELVAVVVHKGAALHADEAAGRRRRLSLCCRRICTAERMSWVLLWEVLACAVEAPPAKALVRKTRL